jgi:N-acetylmuramoyl-L-alanine amidase
MKIVELPSPNCAHRPADCVVDVLVLHYTELPLQEALDVLRDPERAHRVSAHYVVGEDGTIFRLVPEEHIAWHAGRSHWRGHEALNATSIGIEIVNLDGDRFDYPDAQTAAVIQLCHEILERHPGIEPRNVVGHSDVAPKRKIDPGLRFPWARLAANGIGLWPRAGATALEGDLQPALQRFGYPPARDVVAGDIVASFQRHYRPARADGVADSETRALLADLLDQVGHKA